MRMGDFLMTESLIRLKNQRRQGSTLLLALWALFLLSAVVFAWVKLIHAHIDVMKDANLGLEARALAHSGVNVALHPLVTRLTPMLHGSPGEGRTYEATIVGEGGKLNLSYLLAGEDPIRLGILKEYLALRGLTFKERETFVDCLLDWVGPPGTRHANGAQEDAEYKPSNKPFTSLDEVPLVKGSAPLMAYPDWRDDLTLWSQGPLDLEAAPEELLALIPGIGAVKAEQFVRMRQGNDREDGTEDDRVFNNIEEVLSVMGITTPQQRTQLNGLVSFRDTTVRIVCEGAVGDVNRRVEVIARKQQGQNPEILLWIEK